jgi:hypothetical protein
MSSKIEDKINRVFIVHAQILKNFEDYDNTLKHPNKKLPLPITVKSKNLDKIKEASVRLNIPVSHIIDNLIEQTSF